MRNLLFIILSLSALFITMGCKTTHEVPEISIETTLRKAFSDNRAAFGMNLVKGPGQELYIIVNKTTKDSLHIGNSVCWINANRNRIDRSKVVFMQLDSISKTERILKFEKMSYPSLETKVHGECAFVFEKNGWILKKYDTTIDDGHFKLPDYLK